MPAYAPIEERFHRHYQVDADTGCWNWTGSLQNKGYGQITANTPDGKRRTLKAHRVSYEIHHGPIPDGLVVDHMCNNPRCVNPDHLQAITSRQNILRSTAPHIVAHWLRRCLRGHDLADPLNVYIRPDNGKPMCRECTRLRQRTYDQQRRRSA